MSDNNNDTKQPLNKDFREPKIRFPEFKDEWQYQKLSCYLDVSKERNKGGIYTEEDVLSVSGTEGVVNQIEHMGRSYAGASLDNYKVVKTTGVVYTKSPLKSNPYGIIKTNTGIDGIVSSLYGVYVGKNNINTELIGIYFSLDSRLNNYLKPLVNKGPKNTLLISDQGALEGDLYLPKSLEEQNTIVDLFDKIQTLSRDIDLSLAALKKYKEGFLDALYSLGLKTETTHLNNYLKSYSKKNTEGYKVVAVGKYGIKDRDQIYSKEISQDITNNKVIDKDTLVIGMGTKEIDIGVLTEDKKFSVSPAYKTFKICNISSIYLEQLLASQNKLLSTRFMVQGARQGKSVDIDGFLDFKIKVHEDWVQQEVEKIVLLLNKLLKTYESKLLYFNQMKQYLLKNMFI